MFEIRNVKIKLKLENAKQQFYQEIKKFAIHLNNLYSQLEKLVTNSKKMQNLKNKYINKICQKMIC